MLACAPSRRIGFNLPRRTLTTDMTALGEIIESLLSERGWTQDQLSDATDSVVAQGQISNYKSGRRNPTRETLRTIARAFVTETDQEMGERQYRRIANRLLAAAGFKEEFPSENNDLIREIVRQKGYNPDNLTEQQRDTLEFGIEGLVEGIIERGKRAG